MSRDQNPASFCRCIKQSYQNKTYLREDTSDRCVVSPLTGDIDDAELSDGEQSQVCSSRLLSFFSFFFVLPRLRACIRKRQMLKTGLLKTHVFTHCQPFSIQDWLSADPQDMKELLDKLTQENQQIAQLEAQLQVRTTRTVRFVLIIACCL